ncbi:hypothetical protein ASPVEDRAFT_37327 [Aspergillus versicolor CBS 583.65]|uniref:Uncharacterized protein n=1 Tax=Aspergillus versicolor CBS 583.65 TaxID=1036611 RepID=A0A1L9P8Q6_ASPVE|nr:uncharacterized protein ASPVEDRAFT_37327 [Aspergillus versicolor CBS 583.65]OJI97875.1 hypothetical protein ASPVEDRAFT_37327 [Aspergillus versicolor CBS 583.65]
MRSEGSAILTKTGESSSERKVEIVRVRSSRSSTTSRCGQQRRYYRSLDLGPEPDPEPYMSTSNITDTRQSLEMTRLEALHTLDTCRHVIASLELTRLRKSRSGLCHWMGFWERLYERSFANVLSSRVMAALYKVDALFRAVSFDLHQLAQKTELAIVSASSEKEILHILERMEDEVGIRRRRRRRKAQHILQKMRANIEAIPVKVGDELFDDMKRGVFALDVFGDYHPGDERAEQTERMWPQHFMRQPVGLVAVSPYLYHQWRESAVSDTTSTPLTTYSSNARRTDSAGWVGSGRTPSV